MGDTWVTDMTDFEGILDSEVEVPARARRIGTYFGRIVEEATLRPEGEQGVSPLRCRRRPGRRPCGGNIRTRREEGEIRWSCTHCDDNGVIRRWEGTEWDRSADAEERLPWEGGVTVPARIVERKGSDGKVRLLDINIEPGALEDAGPCLDHLKEEALRPGWGMVGTCDQYGSYLVIGCFENAAGSTDLYIMFMENGGRFVDWLVERWIPRHRIERYVESLSDGSGTQLTRAPLEQVSTLVAHSAALRKFGFEVPEEANIFECLRDLKGEPLPRVTPMTGVGLSEVRRLLESPLYSHWWFKPRSLARVGVHTPDETEERARWLSESVRKLADGVTPLVLCGMMDHMSMWHHWAGQPETAALCAALAAFKDDNRWDQSPILPALLLRSAERAGDEGTSLSIIDRLRGGQEGIED